MSFLLHKKFIWADFREIYPDIPPSLHPCLTLTLSTSWMHADQESIVCKFGGDPTISVGEEAICAKVYRRTDGQTDRRRTPRHCINSFLE